MVYKVIGLMSGSSTDGLDIAYVNLQETGGKWNYEIVEAACYPYTEAWKKELSHAVHLTALEYQLLHTRYGAYIAEQVNHFITTYHLHRKVDLVASHGHTSFHLPQQKMTAQLGDGATIAALTGLPVVSDLRAMDVALGGQGAPLVPLGEKWLFGECDCFLNIGGIANITVKCGEQYVAFDVCAANKVLNMLAEEKHLDFDAGGRLAATGKVHLSLLEELNGLEYYRQDFPKSLANSFGTEVVYHVVNRAGISIEDALCTYVEHIAVQVSHALQQAGVSQGTSLLVTGGGAFNTYMIERLKNILVSGKIGVIVPDAKLVEYKEALIMALIGVLRWREEATVLASVTGAAQKSIGGALWLGGEI